VRCLRLRQSALNSLTSIASRAYVRDDRDTPLWWKRDARRRSYFSEKRKLKFEAKWARARHEPERTSKMGFLAHAISGHFGPHRSHELAKSIKLICPSGWSKERRCYASSNGLFAIGGEDE
jgi:hypothetical protein